MANSSSAQRLKGILSVTVLKANNLIKSDLFGENDCYAVLSLEPLPFQEKVKAENKKKQTETYQMTQIHDGSNPIFNEKLLFPVPIGLETLYVQLWDSDPGKDDLLGHGTLSLLDDEQGGLCDTNTNKEWLHTTTVSLVTVKGQQGGTLDLVLHFIPETVAAYIGKKFDGAQAELKKELTQQIMAKVTGVATDKLRGYVGIGV
jgi:Ca2+-dependent lipid-binding protein